MAAPVPRPELHKEIPDPFGKSIIGANCTNDLKVYNFYPNSPYQKCGGKLNDVIKKIGETELENVQELTNLLKLYRPGAKVKVEVSRIENKKNKTISFEMVLGCEEKANKPLPPKLQPPGRRPLPGVIPQN